MMALRSFVVLERLLSQAHPGHPALRGLTTLLPSASFTSHYKPAHRSHSHPLLNVKPCVYGTDIKPLPDKVYSAKKNLHTTACPSQLSVYKKQDSALQVLTASDPVIRPSSAIHQQAANGERNAEKHFILTPKGLFHASPESMKPYLSLIRLDRPIGTWLLFLPCTWSISLAATPGCLPDPYMLALFGLGSFFMRGAGCTINDMWDKDYDARVMRTKDRPLACGQISRFQALCFLGVQLSASLAILLTMNWNTILLGASAMIPVIIYPLMKRVTYWPQAFLGITLNWGVMIAWSGIHGHLQLPGLTLYLSCVLYTMIYDTIYSHQDKDDDLLIGVKSTALKFGDQTKNWLYGFGSVMVTGLSLTGMMCDQPWLYYVGVGTIAAHIGHQIYTVDLNNPDDCGSKFRSNRNLGIAFWAIIVAANLLKKDKEEEEDSAEEDFIS